MLKILTLFILLITPAAHAQDITGETLKDFVFKSKKQLTDKYGKPKQVFSSDEDSRNLDELLGYSTYSWTLKNNIKVEVTYTISNSASTVLVVNYKFNKNAFYSALGWDKPIVKSDKYGVNVTGLQGFTATYYDHSKSFLLLLDNPNIKTFGKKK